MAYYQLPTTRTCNACHRPSLSISHFAKFNDLKRSISTCCVACRVQTLTVQRLERIKNGYDRDVRCSTLLDNQYEMLAEWRITLTERGFPELSQRSWEKILARINDLPAIQELRALAEKMPQQIDGPEGRAMAKEIRLYGDLVPEFVRQRTYQYETGSKSEVPEDWKPRIDWQEGPFPETPGQFPFHSKKRPRWETTRPAPRKRSRLAVETVPERLKVGEHDKE